MKLTEKCFDDLTTRELYELLKARSDVFVVEQKCPYPDIDGVDYESLHLFYQREDGSVAAYVRLFPKAGEPGVVQLGRMLTRERGTGLGGKLLREAMRAAVERMYARGIFLEAQEYATGFYAREGFRVCSAVFLEDGIPHVEMRWQKGENT